MIIERIQLHLIELPLAHPFETSFGRELTRLCILVSMQSQGATGWGESAAFGGPWYSYETIDTNWHVMEDYLAPMLLGEDIRSPGDVVARFRPVRGHPMARSAMENAAWDLLATADSLPLVTMLPGSVRDRVPVGVSVGIEETVPELLEVVSGFVSEGYRRLKLKIKPGWDIVPVRAVRERWPDYLLQVDANSAYSLDDIETLRALDEFELLLIEQPLHHDDIVDHALLQQQIETAICLDESIHSPMHARWALDLGACRNVNIKVGRVGGLSAAIEIHDLCLARGVPVWCGGMLETNVGRAANVALATLPTFTLPGDISASARYYKEDIAEPNFELNGDSTISLPDGPGLGVTVDVRRLEALRLRHLELC
ncbi:MAG: o-succinylbenzoate synthase [Chloroflexota bacterium]|nr:o-succinylbenzoate synthase [Chloroflexota bacterium]